MRRGWGNIHPRFRSDFDPDNGFPSDQNAELKNDITFARDEMAAGRAASALAMLERILNPRNPKLMAVKYREARASRDPATGRPTIV